MTSRERVQKIFRGEMKNSFAISIGGMANDNMSAYAYANLLKYLGMEDKPIKIYDLFQFIPLVDLEVIDRLGGDFVHAQRPRYRFNLDQREWRPGFLRDGTPCYYPAEFQPVQTEDGSLFVEMDGERYARMPKGGLYFDIIRHPLEDAETAEDLRLVHPAVRMSEEDIEYTANQIEDLYQNTEKAVVLLFAGQLIEQAQRDFGFEEFYCKMAIEKELMHAYFQMITDAYLHNLKGILSRAGDQLDVIWFCDDIGTQQTLQISIPMYKEMIKPYEKQMWDYIHENYPHIRILFHSCGAIFDVIPELIDAGVDLLNPVQISAKGMDPKRLKETYGKDIIFWGGGTDTQNLANLTTVQEVEEHASHLLEIFSGEGNYVFSQIHNFQADVSPEKIVAIFDQAKRYREKLEAGEV
jgi:uroporphyrinogen decarboxylase